mmetsp:Transcript_45350/g.108151  ORF Transcript_45350/g.108151 Transcript_45350/m.108151 type:complete len:343 (-) Transcript_45350:640-1668(-)
MSVMLQSCDSSEISTLVWSAMPTAACESSSCILESVILASCSSSKWERNSMVFSPVSMIGSLNPSSLLRILARNTATFIVFVFTLRYWVAPCLPHTGQSGLGGSILDAMSTKLLLPVGSRPFQTVRQSWSCPSLSRLLCITLKASMTMAPAMMAFVVAIAGMMFPAMLLHLKREVSSMAKTDARRLAALTTKSMASSSSLSHSMAPAAFSRACSTSKLSRNTLTLSATVQTASSTRASRVACAEVAACATSVSTASTVGGRRSFQRSSIPMSFSISPTKSLSSTCLPLHVLSTSATALASSLVPKRRAKRCLPHTMQWIGLSGVDRMVQTGKPLGAGLGSQS